MINYLHIGVETIGSLLTNLNLASGPESLIYGCTMINLIQTSFIIFQMFLGGQMTKMQNCYVLAM